MPCALTLASVKSEVRLELGGTSVDVELDDKDIEKCLRDAVRVYNHYRPRRSTAALSISTSQVKYGPLVHPGLKGVGHVSFVDGYIRDSRPDPFDPLSYATNQNPTVGMAEREMAMGAIEISRKQLSVEPEWRGEWEGANYFLYISAGRDSLLCSYEYLWHIEASDSPTVGLRFADADDEDWIIAFTVAKAKIILARVRGKFGGITNSEGSTDSVDAESLASEGREELQALEERIKKRRRPLPPVIG